MNYWFICTRRPLSMTSMIFMTVFWRKIQGRITKMWFPYPWIVLLYTSFPLLILHDWSLKHQELEFIMIFLYLILKWSQMYALQEIRWVRFWALTGICNTNCLIEILFSYMSFVYSHALFILFRVNNSF